MIKFVPQATFSYITSIWLRPITLINGIERWYLCFRGDMEGLRIKVFNGYPGPWLPSIKIIKLWDLKIWRQLGNVG